ncbi:MAG TPA: ATP-binding protein [Thermoanaerobaculia bacterium]|nr:ATP-binding protein [Thermoanaerobaculia bacterium]
MGTPPDENDRLRSVALQNAQSILLARQRAEEELVAAKEALERRTAELERAHAVIRTIAENAASCLLMLDEHGIATYVNPASVEETGYTAEELRAAPFHEVLHAPSDPAGHPAGGCPIEMARERSVPLKKHRDLFTRKDGSTFPVSCSLSPLQRDGRPAGAVLEFRDITDEIMAQKALEDANRRKDQFLATLSHELRTPMTSVLGWARMLKLGLPENEARQAIEAIERGAAMQTQLIDEVLDVSRIMAGKMTFHPVPVEIGPVLRAALSTVHPAATAKGIEVVASVPPSLPRVLGDEGRLQQIVWNLLSNAVKFTPRGGTVTLRVVHSGGLLRLTVQDTGKGIEHDYLPHVFEPFSQEDPSATRSHEGIGLGLSIVRSLVELHGGRIRAASEGPDRGATFTVEIPVIEPAAESEQSSRAFRTPVVIPGGSDLPDLAGARVLVVDDQDVTRELLEAIFRRAKADVRSAGSVREGLAEFQAVMPNVVICDLAMPGEDGFALVRAVRAFPPPSNAVPVIALTAFGRTEEREQALAAGFDEYLKKPVEPEELVATVRRLRSDRPRTA